MHKANTVIAYNNIAKMKKNLKQVDKSFQFSPPTVMTGIKRSIVKNGFS